MKRISKLIILIAGITLLSRVSYAEQSGSSPDSGTGTSVLNTGYSWLVGKGTNYGATQPADWTLNWGTYWNRIMYSAFWEPDGTATESDVLAGKTFYSGNNNRTIKTGTAPNIDNIYYSEQSYVQYDDYKASDYTGEEAAWTNPATNVWLDTRTGLYWARSEPTYLSNSFSSPATGDCSFFLTTPRGSYGNSSTEPECGEAINACAVLSLEDVTGEGAKTDWYLPSKVELIQASIDGMYNSAGYSFTVGSFAASTESSSTTVWYVQIYNSLTYPNSLKATGSFRVKCVRRD